MERAAVREDVARSRPGRGLSLDGRLVAELARPLSWRIAAPAVTALLAIVFATNRWLSWNGGLNLLNAEDERAYRRIAQAAPSLPSVRLPEQHAQRWPVHWAIGSLAALLHVSDEGMFHAAAIVLVIAVVVVLALLLVAMEVRVSVGLLCLSALALNPYGLRFYLLAPGYLADLVFELGLGLALVGLVSRRLWLVVVGVLVGILARQTMVPILPVFAVWVGIAGGRAAEDASLRRRVLGGAVVLIVGAGAWAAVASVASGFSKGAYAPIGRATIYDELTGLPGTLHPLADHFAHVVIAILLVVVVLLASLWAARGRRLGVVFWGSLVTAAVIVAQSALLNPDPIGNNWSSFNEPRLTAMGLIPLVAALAVSRRTLAPSRSAPRLLLGAVVVSAVAMVVGSLHHLYTTVGPASASQTLALQVVVAAVVLVAVLAVDRAARRERRMDDAGLEPATSALSRRRSPS